MKAFVIAIDMPESQEAAQKCVASARSMGQKVDIHKGYTPNDDPISIADEWGIPVDNFVERFSRIENCVAAFLSHMSLWKWAIENKEEVLILEHDAIFIDAVPVASYKGVLSLGAPSYGSFNTPSNIGVNKLVSKQYLPGAHAYMVKPTAAKVLCEVAKQHAGPTDLFLRNELFDFVEEYYPWPVVVRDNFTTIQKEEGCVAKHGYNEDFKIL